MATFDVVIKRGTVIDGTARPRFKCDVGISGDRIAAIETDIHEDSAKSVIDADGKVVAPGFIDAHCHTDWNILEVPWDDHQERQGVTTQIGGLCGTAPLSPREHFEEAEARGLGTNYALFAGHGSIREAVMGEENRTPTTAETESMKALIRKAMDEGALGLSTGLIYAPGRFAKASELAEMATVAARLNGFYATHMRSESDHISEAFEEALTVAKASGARLQISHIKVILPRNWGKAIGLVEAIERGIKSGISITADQYPYTVTGGGLYGARKLVDGWDQDSGWGLFQDRFGQADERVKMAGHIDNLLEERGGAEHFTIIRSSEEECLGTSLDKAAASSGVTPGEYCVLALQASGGTFAMAYESVSDEELALFMRQPWTMAGSDGILGAFHPRTHGTFTRILGRYVREKHVLTLEEAVRKMTSLPAETFGFRDRGVLQAGAYADVVVFDPDTVGDEADLLTPTKQPSGVEHVLVNGVPVVSSGERTGAYPGRPLPKRSV